MSTSYISSLPSASVAYSGTALALTPTKALFIEAKTKKLMNKKNDKLHEKLENLRSEGEGKESR
jgi:hypothetical protein